MMVKAGILNKYGDVLEEFPVVVKAGGAWTSVTPGSQQYWLQAFNNVMFGRWEKIEAGFGRSVLGYFGKTPLPSDPEVVRIASEQLGLEPFDGDPLEAAPKNIGPSKKALEKYGLPVNDRNVFLVLSAMVPGKKLELNEGIRLLTGKGKIDIPLKSKAVKETKAETAPAAVPAASSAPTGPVTTRCTVEENGTARTFVVTLEPIGEKKKEEGPSVAKPESTAGTPVFSAFSGMVEVVDIAVRVGDKVSKGQVIAAVEAMKATHDIKAPSSGVVSSINVSIGEEIDASKPIMILS
jgi:pyruvate carboxylase subunit B